MELLLLKSATQGTVNKVDVAGNQIILTLIKLLLCQLLLLLI